MRPNGWLARWNAVDIALTAGLAVLIGVLFTVWANVVAGLALAAGPLGVPLIYGVWFLGGILPAYVIRKPGIAFLGELIAAHVELLTGSQYGLLLVYYALTQGLASELVFAAGRYRRWGWPTLLLAGAMPAIPAYVMDSVQYGYSAFPATLRGAIFGVMAVSGAVLGGALGKSVADALARTGVLSMFALGEDQGA